MHKINLLSCDSFIFSKKKMTIQGKYQNFFLNKYEGGEKEGGVEY